MNKGKVVRLAGFVGALGLSTVLVTTAIQGTGAYFEDSFNGTMSASSGHLTLDNTSTNGTALDFNNMLPGINKVDDVSYKIDMSDGGTSDVWITFDQTSQAYQAFTGGKNSPIWSDGGLGAYGYFSVADTNGGTAFTSGNLSFPPYADSENKENSTSPSGDQCATTNGRGIYSTIVTATNQGPLPYCGVPSKILLASGLANGTTGTVSVTFGLNGFKQTQQNQIEFNGLSVPFTITATQHGQQP